MTTVSGPIGRAESKHLIVEKLQKMEKIENSIE